MATAGSLDLGHWNNNKKWIQIGLRKPIKFSGMQEVGSRLVPLSPFNHGGPVCKFTLQSHGTEVLSQASKISGQKEILEVTVSPHQGAYDIC